MLSPISLLSVSLIQEVSPFQVNGLAVYHDCFSADSNYGRTIAILALSMTGAHSLVWFYTLRQMGLCQGAAESAFVYDPEEDRRTSAQLGGSAAPEEPHSERLDRPLFARPQSSTSEGSDSSQRSVMRVTLGQDPGEFLRKRREPEPEPEPDVADSGDDDDEGSLPAESGDEDDGEEGEEEELFGGEESGSSG